MSAAEPTPSADEMLAQVQGMLSITPPQWLRMTASLPTDVLTRRPAPGEWSAVDCLRHLIDAEREVFPVRVRAFLAGADITAFDPDTKGVPSSGQSPEELAAELARLREESLALLPSLTPADLAREASHSELGRVTLGELLHEWVAHDLNHTIQAERALMQPFIVASGPWREGFADHDIAATTSAG